MISKKEWKKSFKNINGREPNYQEYQKAISDGLLKEDIVKNKNNRLIITIGVILGVLLVIIIVILLTIFLYPKPTNGEHYNFYNEPSQSSSDISISTSGSSISNDLSESLTEWSNLSLNNQIALLVQAYAGASSHTSILSADKIAMADKVDNGYIQWYDSSHNQHKLNVRIKGNIVTYDYIDSLSNSNEQKTTEISSILSMYYQSMNNKIEIENIASKIVAPSDLEKNETNKDLNIKDIFAGDISSLVGEWRNGKGGTITINADKTFFVDNDSSRTGNLTITDVSVDNPYLNVSGALGNSALVLFKIGFSNPAGDSSDITKARILITQQAGNYPADEYYYRS